MEKKTGQVKGSTHWYLWSALVAIELLMSFSAFGYVHIPPLSVTIAYVPVLVAGALMGPLEAMTVGAVFGAASMWKATATYVLPFDQLFSPFFSGYPVQSVLLSMGSRMLFGLAMGLLYTLVRRWRFSGVWVGLLTFFGSTVHSFFVYSSLWLFFPQTGYTPAHALGALSSPSMLAANVVTTAVVLLLWRFEASKTWRKFRGAGGRGGQDVLRRAVSPGFPAGGCGGDAGFQCVRGFVLCAPHGVCSGVSRCGAAPAGIFRFGTFADSVFDRHSVPHVDCSCVCDFQPKVRHLHGPGGQEGFFNRLAVPQSVYDRLCRSAGGVSQRWGAGCFLMVDLDHFKEINDGFGHPEGDRILREVSRCLQECFGPEALLGRVGGDEFAVFLQPNLSLEEWKVCLRHFQESVRLVEPPSGARRLSCSVGVLLVKEPRPVEELYRDADWLLYQAKAQGRDRYVAGTQEDARVGVHAQAG